MSRSAASLVLALALAAALLTGVPSAAAGHSDGAHTTPRIVAVYPNPVADGDRGEFVVLRVPPGTDLGAYALGDDDTTVHLPDRTASGRVILSTAPDSTESLVDGTVRELGGRLALANGGETVVLRRNGTVLDRLEYADAPAGELRVRDADRRWRPLGATDRPVIGAGPSNVTAFVLPDAPDVATDTLATADRRILVAGYTLTDRAVVDELVAAARRGVRVRVLVDGDPVGGMARRQAAVLDRLAAAGVDVRVSGGPRARYEFHHAKYAVVDDRALVTTENWKPAGLGGNASRGWGVVTDQSPIVRGLAETFRADAGWLDARPWTQYREGQTFQKTTAANATYPTVFEPESVHVEETRLLVAPDNAEPAIRSIIGNATETIDVEQVSIGSHRQPFVRATMTAARRGVRVRILLSSAWYVAAENRRLVAWLNERAARENLPLEARLAEPRGRFEKIHAKGMVVDGETVVLGSLNWNNNSARDNREVVLVLEGAEVGAYYQRVFDADWQGGTRRLPAGMVAALGVAGLAALARARRLRFEA